MLPHAGDSLGHAQELLADLPLDRVSKRNLGLHLPLFERGELRSKQLKTFREVLLETLEALGRAAQSRVHLGHSKVDLPDALLDVGNPALDALERRADFPEPRLHPIHSFLKNALDLGRSAKHSVPFLEPLEPHLQAIFQATEPLREFLHLEGHGLRQGAMLSLRGRSAWKELRGVFLQKG